MEMVTCYGKVNMMMVVMIHRYIRQVRKGEMKNLQIRIIGRMVSNVRARGVHSVNLDASECII